MKKLLLSLLVVLLSLFFFPKTVYADAGLPYEPLLFDQVMVSNKEGAKFYEYHIYKFSIDDDPIYIIPYGEIVNIFGTSYGDKQGFIFLDYKDTLGCIHEEDVKPVVDFFEPMKENLELDNEIYVYKEGGYLYKGPSYIFDKVIDEEIPVGTILKADKHGNHTRTSDMYGKWTYVEYMDKAGWIVGTDIYDYEKQRYDYVSSNPYAQWIHTKGTVKDKTFIYSDDEQVIGTIQGDQEYESYYQKELDESPFEGFPASSHIFSYIKTEALEGWASNYCLLTEGFNKLPSYILSNGSISIYDSDLSTEIAKGRISGECIIKQFGYRKKSEGNYSYKFVPVYLIEYDSNKYGFIRDEDVAIMFNYQEKSDEEQQTNTERHTIWSEPTTRREKVGIIEEGEPLNYKYRFFHRDSSVKNDHFIGGEWTYIETDKYKGWINKEVFTPGYNSDWLEYKKYTEIHEDIISDDEEKSDVKDDIVITYVICGVLVLTTGIVLIIYNKKRKK